MKTVTSKFRALKILVVDDDLISREVSKEILELMDCHVHIASNGSQAIEMANAQGYDLIFMDIQMPEMDGYETARQIRQLQKDGLLIIALTASAALDNQECLKKGMDDYVIKPVDATGFEEKLQKFFKPS